MKLTVLSDLNLVSDIEFYSAVGSPKIMQDLKEAFPLISSEIKDLSICKKLFFLFGKLERETGKRKGNKMKASSAENFECTTVGNSSFV